MQTVSLADFPGKDAALRLGEATSYLSTLHEPVQFMIPPGLYDITTAHAREEQRRVMDGVYGQNPQKVMFSPTYQYSRGLYLSGLTDCHVIAEGAFFQVDGFMEPVAIRNCKNLTFSGLTIDHKRKPYSRGRIIESQGKAWLLEMDKETPMGEHTPKLLRSLVIDPAEDTILHTGVKHIEYIDDYHFKAAFTDNTLLRQGLMVYIWHTYHGRPAILLENCENVTLSGVTIHSQPGMGIVGNRCENVHIKGLSVVPSPGHHVSTNTDATHFTSIKGDLIIENSRFEGCGDDCTNVHGYFQAIIERVSDTVCVMQEKTPDGTHAQSLDYPDVGDLLELWEMHTLSKVASYQVMARTPMQTENRCRVKLDHALPESTEGLALIDVSRLPRFVFRNCHTRRHFARGVLVQTRYAVIEHNVFEEALGPAIAPMAEAFWSEGVCPQNISIRHNTVRNCCAWWPISCGIAAFYKAENTKKQNLANITIENNEILMPAARHAVYAAGVDGLRIRNNTCSCREKAVVTENCRIE